MKEITIEVDVRSDDLEQLMADAVEKYNIAATLIDSSPSGWPAIQLTGSRRQIKKWLIEEYQEDDIEWAMSEDGYIIA